MFLLTANDSSYTVISWADINRHNRSGTVGSVLNSICGIVCKSLLILLVDSFPYVSKMLVLLLIRL